MTCTVDDSTQRFQNNAVEKPHVTTSLVARVVNGDDASWERLVRLYSPSIDRLMSCWHVPVSERESLKNGVFAEALKSLNGFAGQNGSKSFLAWLWTISRRHIKRMVEAERRRPDCASGGENAFRALKAVPDQPSDGDRADLLRRILQQLNLTDNESRLLKLYHLDGLPASETGARMGLTDLAVRQRSARLLKKIRNEAGDLETWLNDRF